MTNHLPPIYVPGCFNLACTLTLFLLSPQVAPSSSKVRFALTFIGACIFLAAKPVWDRYSDQHDKMTGRTLNTYDKLQAAALLSCVFSILNFLGLLCLAKSLKSTRGSFARGAMGSWISNSTVIIPVLHRPMLCALVLMILTSVALSIWKSKAHRTAWYNYITVNLMQALNQTSYIPQLREDAPQDEIRILKETSRDMFWGTYRMIGNS